ncbi:hypothetical protein VNO80_08628 [Phaseolus coccineus]|uniref:Uncharacterized protein n=1 Tax=Phaseolus coccineus TaxID=3886 RepID=A0AAN9RHJ9_PHACN
MHNHVCFFLLFSCYFNITLMPVFLLINLSSSVLFFLIPYLLTTPFAFITCHFNKSLTLTHTIYPFTFPLSLSAKTSSPCKENSNLV